jgi:hypothetical protein
VRSPLADGILWALCLLASGLLRIRSPWSSGWLAGIPMVAGRRVPRDRSGERAAASGRWISVAPAALGRRCARELVAEALTTGSEKWAIRSDG